MEQKEGAPAKTLIARKQHISKQRRHRSPWILWLNLCRSINTWFEKRFSSLGYFIYRNPYVVLLSGCILSSLLLLGYMRLYTISRVEKLYIPENSQAMRDLDRVREHYPLKLKAEEFILLKNGKPQSVLEDGLFKEALTIHTHIMSISGFSDICVKHPLTGDCVTQSALEVFQYNLTKIVNVSSTINDIYNTPSILLQNGRPAKFVYRDLFADFSYNTTSKTIEAANGFRNMYFVMYAEDDEMHSKQLEWEEKYIQYMKKQRKKLSLKGYNLLFSAGRSLDDSIADSASKDIQLIPVSFILMVIFCTITLARFRNKVVGHFCLANGGIAALALGIGAAFGLGMAIGSPYVAFAGVLPFLILGVGIDNIFIIIDSLDRQHFTVTGSDRIAKAFGHVGASITMTTLTDLVAFAVSMVTDFPAIRYFCLYAALSIFFCYLLVITIFVAMVTIDVRRIENGRQDFIPCAKSMANKEIWEDGNDGILVKVMNKYGEVLMKTPVRIVVLIISIIVLSIGCFGAFHIDQSFNMLDLGLKGSDYVLFYEYRNKHYPSGVEISVVIDQPINYEDEIVQNMYTNLDQVPLDNKYMLNFSLNWMTSLRQWSANHSLSCLGKNFYPTLKLFLQSNPLFLPDIRLGFNGKIIASRVLMSSIDDDNSITRKDMMLTLRDRLQNSGLPASPINMMFIYIEQFVIIMRDTIRNLVICCAAILVITLPYLMDPMTTFFVFFGFVCLIFELLGLMYFWNVSLNSISMVVIVMAIGFAVDYSAHIAHAYTISKVTKPEKRAIEALKTMGSSVLMGGVSTFIGILVTAFASSEIFKIFFKMVFGIVILGLLHGLVFLPVYLSLFCRTDFRISEDFEEAQIDEQQRSIELSGL